MTTVYVARLLCPSDGAQFGGSPAKPPTGLGLNSAEDPASTSAATTVRMQIDSLFVVLLKEDSSAVL